MRILMLFCSLTLLAACQPAEDADMDTSPPAETPPVEETLSEAPAPAPDAAGATCGGIAAIACPAGFYCEQPAGQCLEVMDGTGTCETLPEVCTQEYAPLCGCDGQTYGNACEAAMAGASVAAEGECAGTDVE